MSCGAVVRCRAAHHSTTTNPPLPLGAGGRGGRAIASRCHLEKTYPRRGQRMIISALAPTDMVRAEDKPQPARCEAAGLAAGENAKRTAYSVERRVARATLFAGRFTLYALPLAW